jgi:type I restriction enzyme, S subunit
VSAVSAHHWDEVAFADIVEDSAFGPRFSGDAYAENGNIATLRTTDISEDGRISYQTMPLARLDEAKFAKHLLKADDLVITRSGRVGTTALFDGYHLPVLPGAFLIRFRLREGADPRFFRYWFNSRTGQQRLLSVARGAAQQNINITNVKMLKVPLPLISLQHDIASILAAYDDLIENNRRRIQLLEQAARLLYKEWFAHLRYLGHEHVKIKDGVPDGWEKVPISSFCIIGRGGSPRPIKDYLGGTVPWFKIGDATASESPFVLSTKELIIEDGVKKSIFLAPQELILSNSATCGIPNFTGVSGCIHDGWLYFKNLNRVSKWFLFCYLYEKQQEILMGIGEGATQKNLNTDYVGRQSVLLPKEQGILNTFTEIVDPLFAQIYQLSQANVSLRKARDLLLPRLMNGDIAV